MTEPNKQPAILSESAYNMAKWILQTGLPVFTVVYFIVSTIWTGGENIWVFGVCAILSLFFGTALSASSRHYYSSPYAYDGEMVVVSDGGGVRTFSLEVNGDPDELALKSVIIFKVRNTMVPEPPEL